MPNNERGGVKFADKMREIADAARREIERQMSFELVKKTDTYEKVSRNIEKAAQRGEYECNHLFLWAYPQTMNTIVSILESEGFHVSKKTDSSDANVAGFYIYWGKDALTATISIN